MHSGGRGRWISVSQDQPGLQELVPGQPPKPQRNPVSKNKNKNYACESQYWED
ncbi:hypothetical protein I79_002318 [Cricetulus griseus]|uniref:Uncharacterized protein n=1 Tax=Cricetulus griseus TaxID=10029 RepID=G3GX83_CRIGR|nr:hypothetical protein I79_002318 [Cricetulus griseus]